MKKKISVLKKVIRALDGLHIYYKDENILAVCENSETLPFLYIAYEKQSQCLALAYAIDFPFSRISAMIALKMSPTLPHSHC